MLVAGEHGADEEERIDQLIAGVGFVEGRANLGLQELPKLVRAHARFHAF
jgi:hypothetical protein